MRIFAALLGAASLVSTYAQITLTTLLVENQAAPLGIDVSPRFSWRVLSNGAARGVAQTAYRLTLSAVSPGASDVWDSGTVPSALPYLAPYAGPALASDTLYFWSVDVTTSAGSASASSNFSTGFLAQSDWGASDWIGKNTTVVPQALLNAFTSAAWIWAAEPGQTPPDAPPGDIALRLTYAVPSGKTAASATVVVTADDLFTLYANGALVGSAPDVADVWMQAQVFTAVPLGAASGDLVFALQATNRPDVSTGGAGPAGVLFAALVSFSDGSSAILSSSTSTATSTGAWRAAATVPADFQLPSTSDSAAPWAAPVSLGTYGVSPWNTGVSVELPTAPTPSLDNATWIWDSSDAATDAPAGLVAFRRSFALSTDNGKTAQSAQIVITADDQFTLWVNGVQVAAAPNETDVWEVASTLAVPLAANTSTAPVRGAVVFAVQVLNLPDATSGGPSPAGLLASVLVLYSDGSTDALATDASWLALPPSASGAFPDGWQDPGFDDSAWAHAAALGAFGVQPWGTGVTIPDPLGAHPAPLLRKAFALQGAAAGKTVQEARVYYAAGGYAAVQLNGVPVDAGDARGIGRRVLSPGFTKYDTRMEYVVLDVSPLLISGTNVLAAELGRSHYGVTQGSVWNWAGAPWHGEPALRLVLSVVYGDGARERVVSDASWKNIEGPTRLDDIFGGENYDASFEIPDWNLASFDDSAWNTALVVSPTSPPKGALVRGRQVPTRVVGSLTPVNVTQPVPGQFVAAFERVVAGWVRLTVTGPKGSLVTVHYGEKLNPDGTVIYQDLQHYYSNNFQTDRFWLAGTGAPEVFEPKFSYKGYQYIQILGWPSATPPTPADIIGQIVHDDLQPMGDFSCSIDLLNQLHVASVRTLLNNVHSIPTDCPTFEKNGWSGDAQLATEMFLTNLDSQDLLAKYAQDLQDSLAGGPPAVIAPDSGWGANNQADPWHAALILIPAWLYQYRGDLRALTDNYAGMKAYIEFELGRSPGDIATTGLGDWDTPETSPLGGNPPEDPRVPATAYLYHMMDTMSQVAALLNETADATTFTTQAAAIKNAFNGAFLDHATGHYIGVGDSGYRQSHNLLALAFGLTPNASQAQIVADSVVTDINARGVHLNTGALSTKEILPMLTTWRHADVALAVAQQTTFPSWGFGIENGATTMWEHWLVTARSHDHMFLGTFEDWLYKFVLGIQSQSTAFQTVSVAPTFTSSIPSASGWTMTPFGNITVSYTTTGGSLALNVEIPVGVTATVSFASGSALTESGNAVAGNTTKGIQVIPAANGEAMKVLVGSGTYSFVAK